jgi:lipoyl(octanoyl) transferase
MLRREDWGQLPYAEALAKQRQLVEQVIRGEASETLVACSHPPIVTLGKKTSVGDVTDWQGELLAVERGGRATYHGPGQVVLYPIINLNQCGRERDLIQYLHSLEHAIVQALSDWGIEGEGDLQEGRGTGVWVNGKKIASIGIAVKRWVTYHGLAINVFADDLAFVGINPCGLQREQMTSIEELGCKVDRQAFTNALFQYTSVNLSSTA